MTIIWREKSVIDDSRSSNSKLHHSRPIVFKYCSTFYHVDPIMRRVEEKLPRKTLFFVDEKKKKEDFKSLDDVDKKRKKMRYKKKTLCSSFIANQFLRCSIIDFFFTSLSENHSTCRVVFN